MHRCRISNLSFCSLKLILAITALLFSGCTKGENGIAQPPTDIPPTLLTYDKSHVESTTGFSIGPVFPRVNGGAVISYRVDPALPKGLNLDAATGEISGTPTVAAHGCYTITASNLGGSASSVITIAVDEFAYKYSRAAYAKGVPISVNVPSINGDSGVSFQVTPDLPRGLTLNPVTGEISGTPLCCTSQATYTITASSPRGSAQVSMLILVSDERPSSLQYTQNPATYTQGVPITVNFPHVTGGCPTSYAVSPALPLGLALDPTTGEISGTPLEISLRQDYTITASNASGSLLKTITVAVDDEPGQKFSFVVPSALRVGEQAGIAILLKSESDSIELFDWKAEAGAIVGSAKGAIFTAPDRACTVHFQVYYYWNGLKDKVYKAEFVIPIYTQLAILKADDLTYNWFGHPISPWFQWYLDFAQGKKIKATAGIIGKSLTVDDPKYFSDIRYMNSKGYVELWNHGYSHTKAMDGSWTEFWQTSEDNQLDHVLKTQNLAKEKLNIPLSAFGAPFNLIDANTVKALRQCPGLTTWFFGLSGAGKYVLPRIVEAERVPGVPDFDLFKKTYSEQLELLIVQVHPGLWKQEQQAEFVKIVDFLQDKGVLFVFASEAAQLVGSSYKK